MSLRKRILATRNIKKKWPLKYWDTGEWQVVEERINDLDKSNRSSDIVCPSPPNLFRALSLVRPEEVKVVLVGQDPYPNPVHATGVAFSIPPGVNNYPPTLVNIFKEYTDDLGYPTPDTGSLEPWSQQGVLLWNTFPSVQAGKPGSHHWSEWEPLSVEICQKLDAPGIVFCFLGKQAKRLVPYCSQSEQIRTSHPSPLGVNHGFFGSRIFSRINSLLVKHGKEPINWRLDEQKPTETAQKDTSAT